MKSTLKMALLATVLMATPVLAANTTMNTTTDANGNVVAVDADGNPVHHKHWHHHMHKDNGDASMNNKNYINHDANPNYAAVDKHHGYRDADGNWHPADGMHHGYRDADGNWHDANGQVYAHNNGDYAANRPQGYSWDRNMGNTDSVWMGEHFTTTGMAIGDDDDMNNRGAHDFVLGRGTQQDFREGTGHVVKF